MLDRIVLQLEMFIIQRNQTNMDFYVMKLMQIKIFILFGKIWNEDVIIPMNLAIKTMELLEYTYLMNLKYIPNLKKLVYK